MLVEAVIAAVILSLGCLVLTRSLRDAVRTVYGAEEYYQAALLLENLLWDINHVPISQLDQKAAQNILPGARTEINERPVLNGIIIERRVRLHWGNPNSSKSLSVSNYVEGRE